MNCGAVLMLPAGLYWLHDGWWAGAMHQRQARPGGTHTKQPRSCACLARMPRVCAISLRRPTSTHQTTNVQLGKSAPKGVLVVHKATPQPTAAVDFQMTAQGDRAGSGGSVGVLERQRRALWAAEQQEPSRAGGGWLLAAGRTSALTTGWQQGGDGTSCWQRPPISRQRSPCVKCPAPDWKPGVA